MSCRLSQKLGKTPTVKFDESNLESLRPIVGEDIEACHLMG